MNLIAIQHIHADGTPYTPEEEQAAENRRRRWEQENRTYYTLEKNVERIADALDTIRPCGAAQRSCRHDHEHCNGDQLHPEGAAR